MASNYAYKEAVDAEMCIDRSGRYFCICNCNYGVFVMNCDPNQEFCQVKFSTLCFYSARVKIRVSVDLGGFLTSWFDQKKPLEIEIDKT